MNSKRVKKQQVPKEDDRSAIPVLKLSHLYQNNSLLMHSNWSHCLQEVFNSGKLAEKSYYQNSKNFDSLWKISRKIIPSEFKKLCFSLEN